MSTEATQPLEINLDRAALLRIRWADGVEQALPLKLLRQQCPCAACQSERAGTSDTGLPVLPSADQQLRMVMADGAELVGRYGLRIRWQDGHHAGIYEFTQLRELGWRQRKTDEAANAARTGDCQAT